MSNDINKRRMKWQIDFDSFFDVFGTYVIDGHIDDLQPIVAEDGTVDYKPLTDYFVDRFYTTREEDKKCVIVYDPTESEDKRFTICVPYEEEVKQSDQPSDDPDSIEYDRRYSEHLAQHFWEILHEEKIEKQLITHNAGGVTLDMARIHYAMTEQRRMTGNEMIRSFHDFWESFRQSMSNVTGYIFIIKMTSRLLTNGATNGLAVDELMLFRELLSIAQNSEGDDGSKLIVLANKVTDLPMWFTDESINPFVKKLTIDKPSEENKKAFFDQMVEEESFGEEFNRKYREAIAWREGEERRPDETESPMEKKIKRKFLAYTNDFTMRQLKHYQTFVENGHTVNDPDKLGFSVSTFKAGALQNPWEDEEKVRTILNIKEMVERKIKGQGQAMTTVQNILTRAAIGLDRVDNPNAPRVVLFLAGPTGTGKTEICKQIAEVIFGSEDRIVRFDMSEYGQDHSDQKLFGAPPGYVGYEEGGKLTNAMKAEPFSLVLFDEIEKAHGSILDKFLQILGDGRLTDGKGETVSFTDAIIAITSNAGVTSPTPKTPQELEDMEKKMGNEPRPEREINMSAVIEMERENVSPDEIYEQVKSYMRYNVKHYFCCTLNRPELYGRIEDSLVYYNYIGREAVRTISDNKIKAIAAVAKDDFQLAAVECPEEVKAKIAEYCQDEHVRSMGARGIGKAVNTLFNGSLANFLSGYVRRVDGKERAQLVGKTITCRVKDENAPMSTENIEWSSN